MAKFGVIWKILSLAALITASDNYFYYPCPDYCQCNSLIVTCSKNDLSELPIGLDPNVSSLDLSFNNFQKFPTANLANLKYLNMSHNQISVISPSHFAGLKNLEILDISYNHFYDWLDITFSSYRKSIAINKLTYLDISHNPLGNFPNNYYFSIGSLEILLLINCTINNEVSVIKQLPNLMELHLANNPIVKINSSVSSTNLKFIDMSECKLKFIHNRTFWNLTALQTLILNRNKNLKKLYFEPGTETNLLYLDLSDCGLESVPSGNLRKLARADFQFNLIRELQSNSFEFHYYNLEILNLSNNAIVNIDHMTFNSLANIKSIDLSFNKIVTFNSIFSYLRIKTLNLSHNYLYSISSISSEYLEELDVSFCEIYRIIPDLNLLPSLKYLNLQRNFLSELPDNLICNNLLQLDVSSCRIKSINNQTFAGMDKLRSVNLAGNQLTTINPSFFPRTPFVQLENNPWSCNCPKLKSMYEFLAGSEDKVQNLMCDSPEKYKGKTWKAACLLEWYPHEAPYKKDSLWIYSIAIVVTMVVVLFAVVVFRKLHKLKEVRLRQMEETQRAEERETLRRMARIERDARQEASRNAPDPRESQRPPPYSEAVLLPRLDASHPSLAGSLHSLHASNPDVSKKNRTRRKRRRRKSDSSEGHRASRVIIDSETSEPENIQRRETLESDF